MKVVDCLLGPIISPILSITILFRFCSLLFLHDILSKCPYRLSLSSNYNICDTVEEYHYHSNIGRQEEVAVEIDDDPTR